MLHITRNRLIDDVQQDFNRHYPFLKIEFYEKPGSIKGSLKFDTWISPSKNDGQVRRNHIEGVLEIKSWYTVGKVEKEFSDKFGLNVQVFREENGGWVQTGKTDKFTLREQQEMTRHAATSIFPEYREQLSEYDEL